MEGFVTGYLFLKFKVSRPRIEEVQYSISSFNDVSYVVLPPQITSYFWTKARNTVSKGHHCADQGLQYHVPRFDQVTSRANDYG